VPAPPSPCKAYVADLQRRIPELMKNAGVPGAAVAVISNGSVLWAQGFGVRSIVTRAPVEPETVFEVGALSKLISAYAVLLLSNAGKLSLDESLCKYLRDDYARGNPDVNYLTARQLFTDPNRLLSSPPGKSHCGKGEARRRSYTYVKGFAYLEAAIEHVTSQPYAGFVRANVLEPFGLSDSSFVWQDSYARTESSGHFPGGKVGMTLREKYRS
jgi:CubicO group peptidase (beta-lactamase class C family)